VAATKDQSTGSKWGFAYNLVNDPANHDAAGINFTDWRLPSKDELNMMYTKKDAIGGFANVYYWSSTVYDNLNAWVQSFYNGLQIYYTKESLLDDSNTVRVRAVRAF
jgi:hypothetical protein